MTFNYQKTNDEEKCFKQKTINIKKSLLGIYEISFFYVPSIIESIAVTLNCIRSESDVEKC